MPSTIFFLQKVTGSAGTLDCVKTPATAVPLSKIAVKISFLPLYLTPDLAVPISTPFILGILGKLLGASGDIFF